MFSKTSVLVEWIKNMLRDRMILVADDEEALKRFLLLIT
jgi:hypothetical protein